MDAVRGIARPRSWFWIWQLALGAVFITIHYGATSDLYKLVSYNWFCLTAALAVVWGVRRYRPVAPGYWWLLALAFVALSAGDLAWAAYDVVLGVEAPFPSVADALYLGAYPILAVALFGFSVRRARGAGLGLTIDAAIIGISYGVGAWLFFLAPYLTDTGYPLLERLISAAYPGVDILIVVAVARLGLTRGRRTPAILMLCAGTVVYVGADVFYSQMLLTDTYAADGMILDLFWMLGALLWGMAALHPSMRDLATSQPVPEIGVSRRRLALLAAAALAVPVLQLFHWQHGATEVYPAVGAAALLFALVLARLNGLVREIGRSQRHFRALVQNGGDLIAVLGPDGTVRYASPSFASVLGRDPAEMVGNNGLALVESDKLAAATTFLAEVAGAPGANRTIETQITHTDGSTRDVEATVINLLHDPDVSGIVVNARDITDRKRADAALRAARSFNASVVGSSVDGIFAVDIACRLTLWNPAMERTTGLTSEQVLGRDLLTLFPFLHETGEADLIAAALSGEVVIVPAQPNQLPETGRDGVYETRYAPLRDAAGAVAGAVGVVRDVTERVRIEAALRSSEEQFRLLFAANPLPTAVHDRETMRILEVNAAAVTHYGYSREQFLEMTIWDVYLPEELPRLRAFLAQNVAQSDHETTWKHRLAGGRVVDVQVTSHDLVFHDRPAVLVVAQDVTEQLAMQAQLAHQAYHDSLTGLPNRALFLDRLSQALRRRQAQTDAVVTLFLDLDDFKVINDTLGHQAGDELLKIVAERLRRCVRPADTVARLGGDEFTILLEETDGIDGARAMADRISAVLRSPVTIAGREIFVTFSIGIAVSSSPEDQAEDLLRAADAAMYEAKHQGKARYALFDPRMEAKAWTRLRLESDLRQAMVGEQLSVHYQPLVDLESGRVTEVEALLRWHHPVRGNIPPSEFIPVAEESGLIIPIGEWVLEQSCRQVRAWQRTSEDLAELVVAVNLSARQFQHPALFVEVARILAESGLAPRHLKLEITESAAIADAEETIAILKALKDLGVRLAIDDFGAGYAGLSYLRSCPVDTLKIDRSYIAGLGWNRDDTAMIRAVLGLAATLGLDVTAEGIETPAQLAELCAMGCAHGQGYLFAEPQAADEATRLLLDRASVVPIVAPVAAIA